MTERPETGNPRNHLFPTSRLLVRLVQNPEPAPINAGISGYLLSPTIRPLVGWWGGVKPSGFGTVNLVDQGVDSIVEELSLLSS